MVEEDPVVVLDNGSGMVKAGFAGEEEPQVSFPALVGKPRPGVPETHFGNKEHVGDAASKFSSDLCLNYPIKNGIVESWEDMEKILHNCFFNELRVDPSQIKGVLVTEAPLNPKENREKMAQVLFDTFDVKNLDFAFQPVMALNSAGRTTGLVIESGDSETHTVPVFEGSHLPDAIQKMDVAGRDLTEYLQRLLLMQGHNLTSRNEFQVVRCIKERLCYVAQNFEEELQQCTSSSTNDQQYTLPDHIEITIAGKTRIQAPELLFGPFLNGKTCKSVQDLAWSTVQGTNSDVHKDLCKNILMSGGSTMFAGIADRLKLELQNLAPSGTEICVIAQPDRKYAVWKGGSTLASLSTFASSMVSKEDYKEKGAAIIHKK